MTEYLTEQEQIELLKGWLKQYSGVVLLGIIMALAIISGWHYWQNRQINIKSHASAVYDEMIAMRAQNNSEATWVQATKLFTHYANTPYAQMAAFMLAREAVSKKDYPAAEEQLTWVINHSKIKSFKQIARLRLARVQLAENKVAQSLKTLDTIDDVAFAGLIDEVRGDAYVAEKNTASARLAYAKALKELPNAETVRPILQIKYDNLST